MALFLLSQANQHTPDLQSLSPPPPQSLSPNLSSTSFSPSLLIIIIILSLIIFISGLLHLLVRFFLRPTSTDTTYDLDNNVTALQGQLQQLFHLHDCGVDQSFIDMLPVFKYGDIVGAKNGKSPFDCAVCLSEFEREDKLRWLPKCSHAFHMECIDTWLLSHSTCPLCRFNLVSDFSPNNSHSPIVLVLESGSDNSSHEIISEREGNLREFGSTRIAISPKSCDNEARDEESRENNMVSKEKVVPVKLGKYRNVDAGEEGSSGGNVDERRCFSMGSFAYIVNEDTSLHVPIRTPMKNPSINKPILPLTPGHRAAMSECGCDSRRFFHGFEPFKTVSETKIGFNGNDGKGESFSVSKIWLRGKKERANPAVESSSRRAFSFRFPLRGSGEDSKEDNGKNGSRRTISEIDFERWGNVSELGIDEENQLGNNRFENQPNAPSFARRTLLWLVGRQNKVVHSSFSPNL